MTDINDNVRISGEVRVNVFDGDLPTMASTELLDFLDLRWPLLWQQTWRYGQTYRNLVTNVGRQQMTKLIVAETTLGVGYMGLSTSVITAALVDTTLPNELVRKPVTVKQSISSYTQRYVAYFATNAFNSTGINAEGLFDTATTGGSMFADASITLSKSAAQSATVDHRITATTGV